MKKNYQNGFMNFEEEADNNTFLEIKKGYSKNARWASLITEYVTAKDFRRTFFDFDCDYEIEVKKLDVGDVFEIRDQTKKSNKYCYVFSQIYYVADITDEYVELIEFDTITKAIKYQKQNQNKKVSHEINENYLQTA